MCNQRTNLNNLNPEQLGSDCSDCSKTPNNQTRKFSGQILQTLRFVFLTYICIAMPEIFRTLGFVFFFYSNEGQEPIHVHVRKAGGFAKFWIEPVELDFSQGMKVSDIKLAEELINEHIELIKSKWHEVHGS